MNFFRQMKIPFPYTTVGIGVALGIGAAMLLQRVFWQKTPCPIHIYAGLMLVGALVGGILGLCYFLLVEVCFLELS